MDLLKRLALALSLVAIAAPAAAHVTVWPKQSAQGARERYTIRTPNERLVPTVKVEARFPPGVEITAFEQRPDWKLEIKRDADDEIVGAVWTGSLPPDQFTEFGVLAINPKEGAAITWSFSQTYADGVVVDWTGPPGMRTPAPITALAPASGPGEHQH